MCHSEEESIFLNTISFLHAPATVYTLIEFFFINYFFAYCSHFFCLWCRQC